jgi:carbamoyl-phosphate synthase large subunit
MGEKFIEAGKRLGINVELFSYELTPTVPIASISEIIIGKKWKDPEIFADLHCQVENYHIDILIPFVDGAVEIAAEYRDKYNDVWVPVGDAAGAAAMFDKVEADRIFRQCGLPVPDDNRFPLIAKPRFGSASKGIKILTTEAELNALADSRTDYLIQNYIKNRKEITIDCYVALNGEIIATVPRYRIETQGGEASVTETINNPQAIEIATTTLRKTNLRGAVTIQLLEDLTENRLMLMEINPRLGGGAVCACHAGAPLPEFILRDFLKLPLEQCTNWRSGIRICRYFSEVCFDLSLPDGNLRQQYF